jgi:hypothetical protein
MQSNPISFTIKIVNMLNQCYRIGFQREGFQKDLPTLLDIIFLVIFQRFTNNVYLCLDVIFIVIFVSRNGIQGVVPILNQIMILNLYPFILIIELIDWILVTVFFRRKVKFWEFTFIRLSKYFQWTWFRTYSNIPIHLDMYSVVSVVIGGYY